MAKPVFLSLTCQTFVFCSDSARLGEKIPQRSEDDFFSQPVRRTALRIRSKRLPLHVRNRNADRYMIPK
ncbi:hypothetical protein DW158_20135 [Parabacteroides merdae]|uniref:Uncharacterized protein n=5 Tax=Bacteroidaceae TaxID=815 RepID=A0A413ZIJ5_BACSE|nr:hypothetical protein F2Y81_23710 [Bacteroides cellulosilyticus]KAB3874227.1 hypothetical protein GAS34_14105 [Bacteroides uniformis]KAB5439557.1 hypothetical protein F9Z94_05745 [Phocaeicola vulgatus]QBJ19172.1 hypothetical protein EYA81_12990 [Bacteroides sp. A1C1]RGD01407.1 hypothetical protein DW215_20615 [Parabacteroides sp. AM18-12LB]RGJ57708.1 hypothetical protein DXD55_14070 [Bacteroides stercoris]RGN79894.1 hypothetical protein DXB40_19655 [Bacteroides sp. 4_1_36]RGO06880.1 hypoth